jgi:hypothetical protein
MSASYISHIKGFGAQCSDSKSRPCGSFWVYDMDDIEDTTSDNVTDQTDYDSKNIWRYNQDVDLVLFDLVEETPYSHIYCFAEDDESNGHGTSPNVMSFNDGSQDPARRVLSTHTRIGTVNTLDESPPSFTKLQIQDPTAQDSAIIITFQLNEAGTAYCRATRTESGETALDMPINRLLTANWSGAYSSGDVTIEMTKLENVTPSVTSRDDEDDPFVQNEQYDVYCWAKDEAVDTAGSLRVNYMLQDYVGTAVSATQTPLGGMTRYVWVVDSTPPTMIFVRAESTNHETIQVTLQLNEPGTLWCSAAEVAGSSTVSNCLETAVQDTQPDLSQAYCYFETFTKGSLSEQSVFRADIHQVYVDHQIEVNRIVESDTVGSSPLYHETPYKIFCFAEDDWKIEADSAPDSENYVAPAAPNKSPLSASVHLKNEIGQVTTLDDSPPSFTKLAIQDPTAFNTRIIVTFSLNEVGTTYCRTTRTDSGETAADMPVNRILAADWSAVYSSGTVTIDMTNLESSSLSTADAWRDALKEATQYDIYCWAVDSAQDSYQQPRPNYMTQGYVSTEVGSPSLPLGGLTSSVWVTDSTPPTIIHIAHESVAEDTIQMTLQLNEPGTVWCSAASMEPGTSIFCKAADVQTTDSLAPCYLETFVKGLPQEGTVFRADIHNAFVDHEVEVNRIRRKDATGSQPLVGGSYTGAVVSYDVLCFAEDDWYLQATTSPGGPRTSLHPRARIRST